MIAKIPFEKPDLVGAKEWERFWAKVERSDEGCMVWKAGRDNHGYGAFKTGVYMHKAHRVLWEWVIGEIADGLELHHLCHNPSCVNPAHLGEMSHKRHMELTRRDRCGRGHLLSVDNRYYQANGCYRCLTCQRESALRSYYKNKGVPLENREKRFRLIPVPYEEWMGDHLTI